MPYCTVSEKRSRQTLCLEMVCLLIAVPAIFLGPVSMLTLGAGYGPMLEGDCLTIWYDTTVRAYRWGIVGVLLLLCALTLSSAWRAGQLRAADDRPAPWPQRLCPLALLPLVAVARFLGDIVPPAVVSNVAFYLPLAVLAAVIAPGWWQTPEDGRQAAPEWLWNIGVLLVATLIFWAVGLDLAWTTGEHNGDEGHYLTEAESLYRDHDLDIKNQISNPGLNDTMPLTAEAFADQDVAPKSQGGHWYSWHPYGLSLILAPFWGQGLRVRYAVLAFIGALGCLGAFRVSRRVGASRVASAVAAAGLGGSHFWAVYASRALPEAPGGTLLIWLLWALHAQGERRWQATLVAAACCAYLPPMHTRFLPLSLMGMGLFGLVGLLGREPWAAKLGRLTVFTLLCAAGYGAYYAMQRAMFGDHVLVYGSQPVFETFFSFPMGMWATLADVKGIVSVFPLFMWLSAALLAWVVVDREERGFGFCLLAMVLACLVTSCTNRNGIGGACVPGRFLVVVSPLLVPAGAVMLDRASTWARGWFVFLALASTNLLLLVLLKLPEIMRGFDLPVRALRAVPEWRGLFQPHASFIYAQANPYARVWATLYVIAGLGATLWLLFQPRLRRRWALTTFGVVLTVATISHALQTEYGPAPIEPGDLAPRLATRDDERVAIDRTTPSPSWYTRWVDMDDEASGPSAGAWLQPSDAWRYVDPASVDTGADAQNPSGCNALTDGVMDTHWTVSVDVSNFPSLTFTFARPVALCGLRFLSSTHRYPRELLLEGQGDRASNWTVLPQTPWLTDGFWSGHRLFRGGAQFIQDLRCTAPAEGVRRLRITFRPGNHPHDVRLGEVLFMERADPPDGAWPSPAACLATLHDCGVRTFYGPRWITEWMARRRPGDPDPSVPALIPQTVEQWVHYDPLFPIPVVIRTPTAFLTDGRDAVRMRRLFDAVGVSWTEQRLGVAAMFVVREPGPTDDAFNLPLFYWTEVGCLAADTNRFASRQAQRLYEAAQAALSRPASLSLLRRAVDRCPTHEPARRALIAALNAGGQTDEARGQARQLQALIEPDVPLHIRYGGGLECVGLSLSARRVPTGGVIRVVYSWRCPAAVAAERPMVFVHVFQPNQKLAFQDDHRLLADRMTEDLQRQPFAGLLTEQRDVAVPATVPFGDYSMAIGLYTADRREQRLRPETVLPVSRRAVQVPITLTVTP